MLNGSGWRLFVLWSFVASAALGAMVLYTRQAVDRNVRVESLVRSAQFYRARVLNDQLDEETGLRGFLATHDRLFLDPYEDGRAHFAADMGRLTATLQTLHLDPTQAEAENALNHRWIAALAQSAERSGRSRLSDQTRGKDIVDAFRRNNDHMWAQLNARAVRSDRSSLFVADIVGFFAIPIGLLITSVLAFFAIRNSRMNSTVQERERAYQVEKHIADTLQQAFSQNALPVDPAADFHGVYVPSGIQASVGGDWYDVVKLRNHRILFALGDVAGHGISAAVTMTRIRHSIISVGLEQGDPAQVLARVNDVLMLDAEPMMATAVCGYIDLTSGELHYATAGHPPLQLATRDGGLGQLPYSGPPLGAVDNARFTSHRVICPPESLLVLYTDGLVEYDRDWDTGARTLAAVIADVYTRREPDPASAIMNRVFAGRRPIDDVAILTILFGQRTQNDPPAVTVEVGAAGSHAIDSGQRLALVDRVAPARRSFRPAVRVQSGRLGRCAGVSRRPR